jgi:hypothetical protein
MNPLHISHSYNTTWRHQPPVLFVTVTTVTLPHNNCHLALATRSFAQAEDMQGVH